MISKNLIINVYKKNSEKSEVVTQLLYGDSYKIIKKIKSWIKIKNRNGKQSIAIGNYNNEKEIFNFVVESFKHLSPVIDELYNQLQHINPMGMYSDTEIYPSYTLSEAINDLVSDGSYQRFEHLINVNALKAMIYRNRITIGKNSCIMVTALDNYMERNNYDFYSGYTDFVIKLLGDLKYTDVITDVDKLMEARLKECDPGGLLPFDNNGIPYAGGKKKQSRQRKKKQSIKRFCLVRVLRLLIVLKILRIEVFILIS